MHLNYPNLASILPTNQSNVKNRSTCSWRPCSRRLPARRRLAYRVRHQFEFGQIQIKLKESFSTCPKENVETVSNGISIWLHDGFIVRWKQMRMVIGRGQQRDCLLGSVTDSAPSSSLSPSRYDVCSVNTSELLQGRNSSPMTQFPVIIYPSFQRYHYVCLLTWSKR